MKSPRLWLAPLTLTLSLLASCGPDRPTINSFALKAAKTQLTPGEEVKIDAVTEGRFRTNRSDDGFGKFVIASGNEGGTLSAPNGPFTIFRSKADLTDIVTVVVNGKSTADESKTDSITLTVTPNLVKSIVVTSSTPAIEPGGTVNLSAMVTGVGTFSSDIVWTIVKGGGTLSANSGAMVTYDGKGVATGSEVEISAVSKMSSNVKASIKLLVVVKPAITSFEATPVGLPVARTGLPIGGGKAKLAWVVKDAQSVEISPAVGVVQGTSVETAVTQTTEFTLTVKNGPWVVTKAATMKVENQGIESGTEFKPGFEPVNGGIDSSEGNCFRDTTFPDGEANTFVSCWLKKNAADCPTLVITKYNSANQQAWRIRLPTEAGPSASDCNDSPYITRYFPGARSIFLTGTTNLSFQGRTPAVAFGQRNLWAAKVDMASGLVDWLAQVRTDSVVGVSLKIDSKGDIFGAGTVTGKFVNTEFADSDGLERVLKIEAKI